MKLLNQKRQYLKRSIYNVETIIRLVLDFIVNGNFRFNFIPYFNAGYIGILIFGETRDIGKIVCVLFIVAGILGLKLTSTH